MSDDAKTWLCRWCTFEGLTRAHIVSHELDAHPKFYSARETAGCGCGPNEACSRCSVHGFAVSAFPDSPPPQCACARAPGTHRHLEGCPLLAWMRAADLDVKDAMRRMVERQAEDERKPRETQPMVGMDALLPAAPCVHQWVPWVSRRGDLQAWCPNCDKVKAPPEGVR